MISRQLMKSDAIRSAYNPISATSLTADAPRVALLVDEPLPSSPFFHLSSSFDATDHIVSVMLDVSDLAHVVALNCRSATVAGQGSRMVQRLMLRRKQAHDPPPRQVPADLPLTVSRSNSVDSFTVPACRCMYAFRSTLSWRHSLRRC